MTTNSLWQTVTDWHDGSKTIRQRPYGVIETAAGRLVAIHLRPWPKLLAWPEVLPVGSTYHARGQTDRCLLYYNQPRSCPNYLALKYIVSTAGTPYATPCAALAALDSIAALKRSDALLCDAFNGRLSDRLLKRHGWEPHKPQRWHRNFIKRFYGEYPAETNQIPESAKESDLQRSCALLKRISVVSVTSCDKRKPNANGVTTLHPPY